MFSNVEIPREAYPTEEHQMLRETVLEYAKKHVLPYREKWEEQGYCDREAWLKAGELGLLNLSCSAEFGGGGLGFSFSALLIEEMARLGLAPREFQCIPTLLLYTWRTMVPNT